MVLVVIDIVGTGSIADNEPEFCVPFKRFRPLSAECLLNFEFIYVFIVESKLLLPLNIFF